MFVLKGTGAGILIFIATGYVVAVHTRTVMRLKCPQAIIVLTVALKWVGRTVSEMTERERLIELFEKAPLLPPSPYQRREMIANYLLVNGVIVLPISLGDTAYTIGRAGVIEQLTVDCVKYTQSLGKTLIWFIGITPYREIGFSSDDIGKSVFLTRERAESAIKDGGTNG